MVTARRLLSKLLGRGQATFHPVPTSPAPPRPGRLVSRLRRGQAKPPASPRPSPPPRRFKPDTALGLRWGERLGNPECAYLRRWVLNFGPFAIRLHHWVGSDDPRHLHDHPWRFVTLVLKGGYTDLTEPLWERCEKCGANDWEYWIDDEDSRLPRWPCRQCRACDDHAHFLGGDYLPAGSVRFRRATHRHTVRVNPGGCWTLLVTGRKSRDWGFWVDGTWKRMRAYFREHGHHPCD